MMKNKGAVPLQRFHFKVYFLLPFINVEKFNFNDLMDCVIESGSCLQRYLQMCLKMHAA